jgi:malate dehydrogenase (oxaloacetate-decarboxylating)
MKVTERSKGKEGGPGGSTQAGTEEELLARASHPGELAAKYHPYYRGKIEVVPKCPVRSMDDFAIWYTPGVAEPCKAIAQDREKAYDLTNKWNTIAVVTDGTRVLGLGDIGPEAGLPVMEGKSLLFKYLGGVDAFPICLGTKDPDQIVSTVKVLAPSFGGINLEDIAQPKCFVILDRLRRELDIPVFHDDQQGTATVVLAGVINALKVVGKDIRTTAIALIGAGAANVVTYRLLVAQGALPGNIVMVDSKGILNPGRRGDLMKFFPEKWRIALESNAEGRAGGIMEAMKGMDLVIAASKPGPGTIKGEWVESMADDPVVFPIANPIPEIWPWEAKEAGARIVATGRSDFPNQVNNSLGFPGIFRGALDVRAKTISDEMCLAAARELALTAEEGGALNEERILPTMVDAGVFPREAAAVGSMAIQQGLARRRLSREELLAHTEEIIRRARNQLNALTADGFIRPPPD